MAHIQFLDVEAALATDLPWPDVYHSPGYGAALEAAEEGRWEVAVDLRGPILHPYLLRPVDRSLCDDATLFDLATPYGYAGPWSPPQAPDELWREFRSGFRRIAAERGYVAEFLRLTDLVPGRERLLAVDPEVDAKRHNDTIDIDLREGAEAIWQGAEGRHRTAVRKARRLGYSATVRRATLRDLDVGGDFRVLYDSTMQRVGASPKFMFGRAYYELLHAGLGDDLLLAEVTGEDGQPASAALVMRWGARLHYHLAGTDRLAMRNGVNNLLLQQVIDSASELEAESFHLGGGLSGDDALFRFKRSLGGRRRPFWIGRTRLDPARYEQLVQSRCEASRVSRASLEETGFFPAYRAPSPAVDS